jgi:lipoprotein-releasing system permease protein
MKNFPLFVAHRYLFSKKKRNVINIITGISAVAVTIISSSLIILLSAFNGLEGIVVDLFSSVDAHIKVSTINGKSFDKDSLLLNKISNIEGVTFVTYVIEDNIMLTYNDKQYIGSIKGIEDQYFSKIKLDSFLVAGYISTQMSKDGTAIIGSGVANILGINTSNPNIGLYVYYPKKGKISTFSSPFRTDVLIPTAVVAIQQDIDNKCIFAPFSFTADLLEMDNKASVLEIWLQNDNLMSKVSGELSSIMGSEYIVKDRFQQHDAMYKIMKLEKLAVFLILIFILIVASFNMIGALTMLMVEKQKDIAVLWSLGMTEFQIRKVFFIQGILINVGGAAMGIVLGIIICLLQIYYGFVKINPGVDSSAYPIILQWQDIILIFASVSFIGVLATSIRVSGYKIKKEQKLLLK